MNKLITEIITIISISLFILFIIFYSTNSVNIEEDALSFLSDVIGLDLSQYEIIQESVPESEIEQEEDIKIILKSTSSELEASITFYNNKLMQCRIRNQKGNPITKTPIKSILESAKGILMNYKTFSQALYVDSIQEMMLDINEFKEMNKTSDSKNIILRMIETDYTYIKWEKTENGVSNSYNDITLSFYDGFIFSFSDFWEKYDISEIPAEITKDDAITIAEELVQNYTYVYADNMVGNFSFQEKLTVAELSMQIKEEETVYPLWHIKFRLTEVYPGLVTEIYVSLWADTGKIENIEPVGPGLIS